MAIVGLDLPARSPEVTLPPLLRGSAVLIATTFYYLLCIPGQGWLLSALDPIAGIWVAEDDEDETAWVRHMAESAAESLGNAGVAASSVVLEGDPSQVLLEEAERWRADTIFVRANGLGVFERLFIGTVSSAVATRANCSVEVVPSPSGRG